MPDEVIMNIKMKMWDCIHLRKLSKIQQKGGGGGQKRKLSGPLKKYNYITNSKEEWRDEDGQGEHK